MTGDIARMQADGAAIQAHEPGHRCLVQCGCPFAVLVGDHVSAGRSVEAIATGRDLGGINDFASFLNPGALLREVDRHQQVRLGICGAPQQHAHQEQEVLLGGEIQRVTIEALGVDLRVGRMLEQCDSAFHIPPCGTGHEKGHSPVIAQVMAQVVNRHGLEQGFIHRSDKLGIGISPGVEQRLQNGLVPLESREGHGLLPFPAGRIDASPMTEQLLHGTRPACTNGRAERCVPVRCRLIRRESSHQHFTQVLLLIYQNRLIDHRQRHSPGKIRVHIFLQQPLKWLTAGPLQRCQQRHRMNSRGLNPCHRRLRRRCLGGLNLVDWHHIRNGLGQRRRRRKGRHLLRGPNAPSIIRTRLRCQVIRRSQHAR